MPNILRLSSGVVFPRSASGFAMDASAYLNWDPTTLGTGGYGLRDNGGVIELKNSSGAWLAIGTTAAVYQASPSNPTGTTDTAGKMMGLAGAITPNGTRIHVIITGTISNGTISDGAKAQIRYGTGTAPVNGAALTGTAVGSLESFTVAAGAELAPFALVAIVTGLTAGTAYWIDSSLAAITAGTATITGVSITAHDIA